VNNKIKNILSFCAGFITGGLTVSIIKEIIEKTKEESK
jgi:hypothetical protein